MTESPARPAKPGAAGKPGLSALYQDTHARLAALVAGLSPAELTAPVPACPGWSVRDVVAHELAVTEDALAGRLTGPPSEEQTAAQVARFRGHDMAVMLAGWAVTAPQFADLAAAFEIWPAVIDIVSHEQDIRGALGRPGGRDSDAVRACADALLGYLTPPVPLCVLVEDAEFRTGPDAGTGPAARTGPDAGTGPAARTGPDPGTRPDAGTGPDPGTGPAARTGLTLVTSRFEALRWRMGRRSRAQLAALHWSGDPAQVLDHLVIFGPAAADIIE